MTDEKKHGTPRRLLGGLYEFYKSFSTLNFTILVALVAWAGAKGMLERERLAEAAQVLREQKVMAPAPEVPADLKEYEALETNEEREAFLERGFERLVEARKKWDAERDSQKGRADAERATLDGLKKEVERARQGLDVDAREFAERQKAWAGEVDEAEFAAQVAVYLKLREGELAELLLTGKGEAGDRHIVRVLRAMAASDQKKAAKLLGAMLASDMGGPERVRRIEEMWRAGEPEASPAAPPEGTGGEAAPGR